MKRNSGAMWRGQFITEMADTTLDHERAAARAALDNDLANVWPKFTHHDFAIGLMLMDAEHERRHGELERNEAAVAEVLGATLIRYLGQ